MNTNQPAARTGPGRIYGNGEMAEMIRAFNWQATALGPISDWPTELVMAANMMLASKSIATLYWGPQQLMIYNDFYRPQLGSRHPAALGKPLQEVWSEVYEAVAPLVLPPFQTGVATTAERVPLQVLTEGRLTEKIYTVDNTPVRGETSDGSTILGVYQTATDYTQTVQAERRFRASEAQAARVLESIGDAVIVTDVATRIVRMNAVAERLTGWTSEEARQRSLPEVFRIVSESTLQPVENAADKVKRFGGVVGLAKPTVLLAKDGRRISIDDSGAPIRNDAGELTGVVLVFRDIAERRAAEIQRDRLFGERNRFYTLAESSQDFISMCDLEGKPFYGNPAACNLLGVDSTEQLKSTNLVDFFFPEDHLLLTKELLPKVLRDGHAQVEMRFRHQKTGDAIPMSYQVFLLEDEKGKPFGFGTVSRDLTYEKQTSALLLQTEKLTAVGRLASSIAHEINNPLEAVTNLLYLMRTSQDLPEVHQYVDIAERELRRVSLITNQTLRFHKQATSATAQFCYDLIGDSLAIYQGRIVNQSIRVEKRKRAEHPVVCLGGEIRQVLSNLIGNAIDAMPSGGRLVLRSREVTNWKDNRRGVVLTVADTGTGISPATQKKIFEAFFTTKGIGGTGLGLWVSHEIVARHHGYLRLRSCQAEGHSGTVFNLFLPFDEVPEEAPETDFTHYESFTESGNTSKTR